MRDNHISRKWINGLVAGTVRRVLRLDWQRGTAERVGQPNRALIPGAMLPLSVSPCAISSRVQITCAALQLQALLLLNVQKTSLFPSLVGSLPTRWRSGTGIRRKQDFV